MSKLVSVIIPTYNGRDYVAEAVESVLAQTYRPIEVAVVDDGSTDGTETALRQFGDRIQYLCQQNRGPAAARNLGIQETTGEYVAFLDADDLWMPTKIEKQVALIERSPQVGVVHCAIRRVDLRTGATELRPCHPEAHGDIHRKLLLRNRLSTSSVLARRACFDRAGLFEETLRGPEDWDLWIRISRHFHFDYLQEPLVIYRVHGNNISKKIAAMHGYQMQVIRRAFAASSGRGRGNYLLRRRSLSYVHFDTGDEYLDASQYGPALRHLIHSLVLWPFDYRTHLHFARALMRKPV